MASSEASSPSGIMSLETEPISPPPTFSVGEKISVEVTTLNSQAEGIARPEGIATFIPGLLPGDRAEIEIVKTAKTFVRGMPRSLSKSSADRESPLCPVHLSPDSGGLFSKELHCGGCQLQDYRREKELAYKRDSIAETLLRVGGITMDVEPVVPGHSWNYRNKMSFALSEKEGKVRWGLRAIEEGERSVALELCHIARPELWESAEKILDRLIRAFGNELVWNGNRGYLRGATVRSHTGRLHLPRQERDRASLEPCTVAILAVASQDLSPAMKAKRELSDIPGLRVFLSYSDPRANNIYYDRTRFLNCLPNRDPFWGEAVIPEELAAWHTTGPWSTLVGPMNFLQVNDEMAEKLYSAILNLEFEGEGFAIDAFCGVGILTRALAHCFEEVMGIELDTQSIKLARNTARRLQDCRVEWVSEPAESVFRSWSRGGHGTGRPKPDLVVLDPPRKGCQKDILRTLNELRPKDVVYVSCHPAALARDLKTLCKKNFEVVQVQPFDLFPQTHHVETLVHLKS